MPRTVAAVAPRPPHRNPGGQRASQHRTAPHRKPGWPARLSHASLGHDRKSLEAQLRIPPAPLQRTSPETSYSLDTSVFTPLGAETWKVWEHL